MLLLDVISRVVHVGTAITLVGGSLFTVFVLMPSAKELSEDAHKQLATAVGSRWKRFVHAGLLLFLVSGFYNYYRAIPKHDGDALYHALVGTKIMLAMAVFFIASALVGKSPKLQKLRDHRGKWLKILLLLAATVVCISGFVKVRPVPTGAHGSSTTSTRNDPSRNDPSRNDPSRNDRPSTLATRQPSITLGLPDTIRRPSHGPSFGQVLRRQRLFEWVSFQGCP